MGGRQVTAEALRLTAKSRRNEPIRRLQRPRPSPVQDTVSPAMGLGFPITAFHVGVLWRLNEAELLGRLNRISSVSGGSITAGVTGEVHKGCGPMQAPTTSTSKISRVSAVIALRESQVYNDPAP